MIIQAMKDIVNGIKHMHNLGIAHRDLKIENILVSDAKFKLADFGSASSDIFDCAEATRA